MNDPQLLLDGLGFPESTRWHDGRVWLCNWGPGEVLALESGEPEVAARVAPGTIPFSIDWLPDGRLLIVDGPRRALLRQEGDGTGLSVLADLTGFGAAPFNELVVDGNGNAYVNGGPGLVVRISAHGDVTEVASGLRFPNGMALLNDDSTLVVADSHSRQLIAFDIDGDRLAPPRVWADLEHAPDGICADSEGAIWSASVPGQNCVRVKEGGEILARVATDRGCFACMLGGEDGRTLFIAAAKWRGMEAAMRDGPGTTGRLLAAPGQPAPHAGRP